MSQRLNNLNEIISVLKSGAKFYRKSARQVKDHDLAKIFSDHADLRDEASTDLSAVVEECGGEVSEGSYKEETLALASRVSSVLINHDDSLISGLEEHEDRTLNVFRNAIQHKDNEPDHAKLADWWARFQTSHQTMRTIKHNGLRAVNPDEADDPAVEETAADVEGVEHSTKGDHPAGDKRAIDGRDNTAA